MKFSISPSEVLIVAVLVGGIGAAAWRYFGDDDSGGARALTVQVPTLSFQAADGVSPSMPTVSPAMATAAAAQPRVLRWFMTSTTRATMPTSRFGGRCAKGCSNTIGASATWRHCRR